MKTRSFYATKYVDDPSELTAEQREAMANWMNWPSLVDYIAHTARPPKTEAEAEQFLLAIQPRSGRAKLRLTIKVKDTLQHNPHEGVHVYGVSSIDHERIMRVLGDDVYTSHGRHVERWHSE